MALGSPNPQAIAHWPRPHGALVCVAMTRLDNRSDLCRQLGLETPTGKHSQSEALSDAQIILHAYARWGLACVEQLLGAFVFAIWDEQVEHLFLARDHMGNNPLFFHSSPNHFLFAHEPKYILRHPAVPRRLNRRQLAKLIVPSSNILDRENTYYEDIFALPGANALVVTADEVRRWSYWAPDPERRLDIPAKEVPDAVRAALFQAVAACLPPEGPVVSLLSGGLDSSAIVAVAATLLKHQNRQLTTLSAVLPPNSPATLVDERPFIDQFRSWDNIDLVYVTDPDRGPFDKVDELVRGGERPIFTSRHYLYSAFAQAALERGASVLLDGIGGEFGPTFPGYGYYPELFLQGRWRRLSRELTQRAAVDGHPLWRTTAAHLVRPLLPARVLRLLGVESLRFGIVQSHANHPLQPDFVAENLGVEAEVLLRRLAKATTSAHNHRLNQARPISVRQGNIGFGEFVGYADVEMRFPFMDKRLLELCLAAPGEVKFHNGHKRGLVRTALDGLLPPAIQWRRTKEPFDPGYPTRYNRQRSMVVQLLASIPAGDPLRSVVDIEKLRRLAAQIMTGNRGNTPADFVGMHTVTLGVYLIAFLRLFDDWR